MTSHTGHLLRMPKCHRGRGFCGRLDGPFVCAERRCWVGRLLLSRGTEEAGNMAPGGGVPTIGPIGWPFAVADDLDEDRALEKLSSWFGKLELRTDIDEESSSTALSCVSTSSCCSNFLTFTAPYKMSRFSLTLKIVFQGGGDVAKKLCMSLCSAATSQKRELLF